MGDWGDGDWGVYFRGSHPQHTRAQKAITFGHGCFPLVVLCGLRWSFRGVACFTRLHRA